MSLEIFDSLDNLLKIGAKLAVDWTLRYCYN